MRGRHPGGRLLAAGAAGSRALASHLRLLFHAAADVIAVFTALFVLLLAAVVHAATADVVLLDAALVLHAAAYVVAVVHGAADVVVDVHGAAVVAVVVHDIVHAAPHVVVFVRGAADDSVVVDDVAGDVVSVPDAVVAEVNDVSAAHAVPPPQRSRGSDGKRGGVTAGPWLDQGGGGSGGRKNSGVDGSDDFVVMAQYFNGARAWDRCGGGRLCSTDREAEWVHLLYHLTRSGHRRTRHLFISYN